MNGSLTRYRVGLTGEWTRSAIAVAESGRTRPPQNLLMGSKLGLQMLQQKKLRINPYSSEGCRGKVRNRMILNNVRGEGD